MDIIEKKFIRDIEKLETNLNSKKKEYIFYRLNKQKEKVNKEFMELFDNNDMEIIYGLLFGYYLCNEYKNNIYENYLNKVAELLNLWPNDVLREFEDIFSFYEEYENLLSDGEIGDKLNFYIDNLEKLDEDDLLVFNIF